MKRAKLTANAYMQFLMVGQNLTHQLSVCKYVTQNVTDLLFTSYDYHSKRLARF